MGIIILFIMYAITIIIFALIYKIMGPTHFNAKGNVDYIFLSTTLMTGVGFDIIYPTTNLSKIIVSIQQIILLVFIVLTAKYIAGNVC